MNGKKKTLTKQQRPEGAAPLVGSKDFYEKVNPYWLDQATSRKRQAASNKPQATSLTKRINNTTMGF